MGSHLTISILLLLIFSSCPKQRFNIAQGRKIFRPVVNHSLEEKAIGSRPPRCERIRCISCGHCEAIQVPTNPQVKIGSTNSSSMSKIDYARGDDGSSNYKPMSWKCKCGDSIFNP